MRDMSDRAFTTMFGASSRERSERMAAIAMSKIYNDRDASRFVEPLLAGRVVGEFV